MDGFSTAMILLVVVCFNTMLFASLGLYLYRQAQRGGASGREPGL